MKKTILMVDDEPHLLSLGYKILSKQGYKVKLATNGKECLEKLKEKPLPDLILIDMFMPDMSGRELLEKIRANKKIKDLKCAFLTVAELSKEGEKELKALEIVDYIKKPFKKDDLIARVKKMLE